MSGRRFRIGTRGSQLALWQARTVAALLEARGDSAELAIIRTSGDRLQEAPLSEIGGKRLFVKEIEDALLRGEVDLAVHSAKDLPAVLPDGLGIAAVLPREDPRDALALPGAPPERGLDEVLSALGDAPVIGTGSVRRIAQLAAMRPRATFAPIRGNVDTRLKKLDAGGFHALVLAAAGLKRLGFGARVTAAVPIDQCVPAPGQGIVAVEIRAGDEDTRSALAPIGDGAAWASLEAERSVVTALGGGCQLPLGAIALRRDASLEMLGVVASLDGRRLVRHRLDGPAWDPRGVGARLAEALSAKGAGAILDEARRAQGAVEGSY